MRSARRFISLALTAVFLVSCDSGDDELTIDQAFFVGSWSLVSASDATGDRTADLNAILTNLSVVFTNSATFNLSVDFTQAINDAGTTDLSTTGSYTVSGARQLVLTESGSGTAASFGAAADSRQRVDLSAPAVIVQALLGQAAGGLNLTGTVILTMAR